jgi:hypothetical protein
VPVVNKLEVDSRLTVPCAEYLPKLKVTDSKDWQEAILLNRVASEKAYQECRTKHLALVKSVGLESKESKESKYNLRRFLYD